MRIPQAELSSWTARRVLVSTILILLSFALLVPGIHPSHAAPTYVVTFDANSVSSTDVSIQASASTAKTFRIGAVVNASILNPLSNIFGFQFNLHYNRTLVVPQGDPSLSSIYPDGADSTVNFGSQTTLGSYNWAGQITAGHAFGTITLVRPGVASVIYTLFPTTAPVTLSANTILANVAFELLNTTLTPQTISISDVLFEDSSTNNLGVIAGANATETITNDPPVARFSVTKTAPYVFTFDATASTDGDGTIASPAGYFWDFGDGTQDLGTSGTIVTHDYGFAGQFDVSLRVVDNLGATGSARDILGGVITNSQPSHTDQTLTSDTAPQPSFTFSPANPSTGTTISFDGSASSDPDGTITSYAWDFGDTMTASGVTATHSYATPGTYVVSLTETDNFGITNSTTKSVMVVAGVGASISVSPASPIQGMSATFTGTATGGTPSYTYNWDFGDGSAPASGASSTHTFTNTGTFTVTLTVTDSQSRQGATSKSVTVVADMPPSVSFTSPTGITSGQSFTLTLSISDPDGSITSYKIDWGDQNVTTYTSGQTSAVHTYTSSGSFVITVTATDNGGKNTSTSSTISIAPAAQQNTGLPGGVIPYIIIAIVVAGIIAFLMIRRGRAKPPKQGKQPTTTPTR